MDFVDDIVLLSSTKQQIQEKTTRLDEEARRVGLKINKEKTKVIRINKRNQEKIMINGQDIEDVDEFMYLGAKVCKEVGGMKDFKNRLSKARGAFTGLDVATCGVANATGFGPLATNFSRVVASLATTISSYYFIFIYLLLS